MRAWQIQELGDPLDKLAIVDVDAPTAGDGQVVVDVAATGLSFPDVLSCRGEYQVKTQLPYTPGGEAAGVVAEIGAGVDGLEVGQRVMLLGGAGLAEQVVVNATSAWAIPDALSFGGAAAIPVNYGTTWFALHERARVQAGETVLITGAAGGVGSAAIQIAKAAGATVIAVAGGEQKVAKCAELGADHVIDHHETPAFVDTVRELSGGGVDVAYEPVGGETFQQVRRCMGWDGRLLVIGFVAGIPEMATNHILLKNYSVVGVHWGASLGRNPASLGEQMRSVLDLAATGAVDPLLNASYGFDDAAQALQDLADRKTFGKVTVER